jgi:hypothetical protein
MVSRREGRRWRNVLKSRFEAPDASNDACKPDETSITLGKRGGILVWGSLQQGRGLLSLDDRGRIQKMFSKIWMIELGPQRTLEWQKWCAE